MPHLKTLSEINSYDTWLGGYYPEIDTPYRITLL